MIQELITFSWLVVLSIEDLRLKKVHGIWLVLGIFISVAISAYGTDGTKILLWEMAKAIAPGIVFIVISICSKKVGLADGIVLGCVGIVEGHWGCLCMLTTGLLVTAVFSGILLLLKRADTNTEMPFLPFLTVGWLIIKVVGR